MVLVREKRGNKQAFGSEWPRVMPPRPVRSDLSLFEDTCRTIGITLYPWQHSAALFLYAVGPDDRWLFPEFCGVVARQQGKTELIVPHILTRLRMGRRVMHTAQDRQGVLRDVYERVADLAVEHYGDLLAKMPRFSNGQEEVRFTNNGRYRIVAPSRQGARGPANDDVILDEVREHPDYEFVQASAPTLAAAPNPQYMYMSNAGEDDSVVLNGLRLRAGEDPNLAYLEWSAAPELDPGDKTGWYQANPAIGHNPGMLRYLEAQYNANRLQGTMAIFETEHLCRWVSTMREPLVGAFDWVSCRGEAGRVPPIRPVLAVAMSPEGTRASVAMAWRTGDGVSLRLSLEATGDPINTDALGEDVRDLASRVGAVEIGYDPLTDRELVKYARKGQARSISGQEFANASSQFVNLVGSRSLQWEEGDPITTDLQWTSRKPNGDGSYHAVRAQDDRPITAALAAIRAVWLASGEKPGMARIM